MKTTVQKILVVEDSEDLLEVISLSLKKVFPSAEIIEITNGFDALEKLKGSPPDLLVLDICLPFVNGIEIVKKINENSAKDKIKIVAISGHLTLLEDIQKIGVDQTLAKPFISKDLLEVIKPLFD